MTASAPYIGLKEHRTDVGTKKALSWSWSIGLGGRGWLLRQCRKKQISSSRKNATEMSGGVVWTRPRQCLLLLMMPGQYKVLYKNRVQGLLGNAMPLRAKIQTDAVKSCMPSTLLDSRQFIRGRPEEQHLKDKPQNKHFIYSKRYKA